MAAYHKIIKILRLSLLCASFALVGCATTMVPNDDSQFRSGVEATNQGYSVVLTPRAMEYSDVIERISLSFGLPAFRNPLVEKYENWHRKHPKALAKILTTAKWSMPWVYNEVVAAGFPSEIALLPVIESGYNPLVKSHHNAQGLWQLVKNTGKHYGLERNYWIDERRDLEKSTRAALTYLGELNKLFAGDWLLTLAAYNTGQGRLKRKIQENIARGGSGKYAELKLSKETTHFIPKLIAIRNIIRNPQSFGIQLPLVSTHRKFVNVTVSNGISHKSIAKFCATNEFTIRILNASHQTAGTPPGTQTIRIPENCEARLVKQHQNNQEPVKTPRVVDSERTYIVQKGDSLWKIARKNNINVNTLYTFNPGIKNALQPGQIIRLNSHQSSDTKRIYTVKNGDTLSRIAHFFSVSQADLADWNNITLDSILRLGQKIKIY